MNKTDTSVLASSFSTANPAVQETRLPVSFPKTNGFSKNAHINVRNQTNGRVLLASSALENKLLSSLDQSSLINLLPFMERVSFSSDEYLFFPEKRLRYVYFPESAVVSEIQILEDGRTVEVAMTGRESAIGLSSVFGHKRAATWMQTTINGSALRINVEILRDEFGRSESFQKICFEHINDHIRCISKRVVCYSFHSVQERFCTWLLMLSERKDDGRFPLTHERIARLLGAHRPSITLIAKKLRDKNVIDYLRGRIFITDRRKLESCACACYMD
jgi:CRP-like cAMP-binding protein